MGDTLAISDLRDGNRLLSEHMNLPSRDIFHDRIYVNAL